VLMLTGIDDPKLDSTASHPSSSSHSLPRRVVCQSRAPRADDYGWCGSMASERMFLLLSVGRQSVSDTVSAVSEPSVSAVVSVAAITGFQIQRHFRLRTKPEKVVSVGLYYP